MLWKKLRIIEIQTKTKLIAVSDAAITRYSKNTSIRQLRDPRYPIRLRYHTHRVTASWFVVRYSGGRTIWRKVGNWPALKTQSLLRRLSDIQAELAVCSERSNVYQQFETIGELLDWYTHRVGSDSGLTKQRKRAIQCIVKKHLQPIFVDVGVERVDHDLLDRIFFWPLQEKYSASYVRSIWVVLKQAFKKAFVLKRVSHDLDFYIGDFIAQKSIRPKSPKLHTHEIAGFFYNLKRAKVDYGHTTFILMMLLHGTRIGETRLAKWDDIGFYHKHWHIPAHHTKTYQAHTLPLTDYAINLLKQHKAYQRESGYKGPFLFPNQRRKSSIDANQANLMVRSVSHSQWTAHDLRKLARTIWAELGVDYMIGELLLNHKLSKLDQTYIFTFAESRKREALNRYHQWFDPQGLKFFASGSD